MTRHTMIRFVPLFFVAGCGDCIPRTAKAPESVAVYGAATEDVAVVRSADELRAALARVRMAAPPASRPYAQDDPAELAKAAKDQLDAFVAATRFETNDVALVRAGAPRANLTAMTTNVARATLYFTGTCSPCGGGDPGSYERARVSDEASRAQRVELVRVPKGAHVEVHTCSTSCGTCPNNVP